MRHILNLKFIARLKADHQVVIKETGTLEQVRNLESKRYQIYLMNRFNNKVDLNYEYTLIIHKHLKNKEPIRLLT